MSTSLGEKLRQAREARGISIAEVAEQTRISSLYLKSIEDDNYKPLPGGIFNKGFVKAYAKYVGVDEQEALQDYATLVAQHEETNDEFQPRYRPEVLTDDRSLSSLVPTIIFAVIILGLMTGGILFVVSYIQNQPETPAVSTNPANNASSLVANTGAANSDGAPAIPNEIRVEFKALSEKVSVTSTVDGILGYDEVTPDTPKTYSAQQGLKLRYYRGFADKVQISLNGKQIASPPAPPKGNVEFEINRENVGRIFESGRIVDVEVSPPTAAQPTQQPAPVATPAASSDSAPANIAPARSPAATPSRPAFTPVPTPRRSPTPIIVGRPPAPRPSPE
jgi:cytoskeleton protein RodZ